MISDVVITVFTEARLFFRRHCAFDFGRSTHGEHGGRYLHALRHERTRGHHRTSPNLRAVQNNSADADQSLVLDRTSMQHHAMSDGYSIPHEARVNIVIDMQNAVVLYAGLDPNADVVHVSANRDVQPNARPVADHYVANHLRARVDVGGVCDARRSSAIGSNHFSCKL